MPFDSRKHFSVRPGHKRVRESCISDLEWQRDRYRYTFGLEKDLSNRREVSEERHTHRQLGESECSSGEHFG